MNFSEQFAVCRKSSKDQTGTLIESTDDVIVLLIWCRDDWPTSAGIYNNFRLEIVLAPRAIGNKNAKFPFISKYT
jgi:hypothetical protein